MRRRQLPGGGGGCPLDGKALAAGANEDRDFDTLVPVLATQQGQTCVLGNRILPPGRYRVVVSVFATQTGAAAGTGGRRYEQDFDLLAGLGVQLVEINVSLDLPDGGAGGGGDAGADAASEAGAQD